MENKAKPYQIITGDGIYFLCMKGIDPKEVGEVNIILATFDENQLPLNAKVMAHTVCDLLNSQVAAIQMLSDKNYAQSRKMLELLHKFIPFGGPSGDG